MPAKKKKAKPKEKTPKKEVNEITEAEPSEVSEKKPSKKAPKYVTVEKTEDVPETGEAGEQAAEDKDKKKEEAEAEVKTITSFSQLDAKKPLKEKETEEEAEDEGKKKEALKEEKAEETTRRDKISADEVKKWISDAKPEPLDEGKKGQRINLKILLVIIGIAAISGVVVGGFIYFNSRVSKEPVEETVEEPTPIPEEDVKEEEKMVEEEVNLGEFSARVLNGAGIPGEASKVKSTLTDAGLEEIDTGNADSYDYEKTEVRLKESTPEGVYKAIEEALSGEYDVTKSETPLSDDSEYDVEVVVGTRK